MDWPDGWVSPGFRPLPKFYTNINSGFLHLTSGRGVLVSRQHSLDNNTGGQGRREQVLPPPRPLVQACHIPNKASMLVQRGH